MVGQVRALQDAHSIYLHFTEESSILLCILKKKKVYYKMPRETNAFSSPLRVSRSHWFREDKACGSLEGLDGSVGPTPVTSCVN